MGNNNLDKLSLDEIQKKLDSLENHRAALENALVEKRAQTKKELANEIKEMIGSKGYDLEEIIGMLSPRKRGAVGTRSKSNRSYTRYVDPANPDNIYIRGVLPGWMKEQMTEKGLEPKDKDDREKFKAKYLKVVAA